MKSRLRRGSARELVIESRLGHYALSRARRSSEPTSSSLSMMSSGSRGIESKGIPSASSTALTNCRGRAVHGQFADSFRTIRSVDIPQLFEEHANRRQVARSRHNVIGHLAVLHAPILPNHFLVKAESDSLGNAADDLPLARGAGAGLCQLPAARRSRPLIRHRSQGQR